MEQQLKRIDDFLIGELYPNEDIYVIIPQNDYYNLMFKDGRVRGKVLDWDSDTSFQKENVRAIKLDDYMKLAKELPKSIYEFPHLEYLEIPSHLIKQIDWNYFNSLKVLISTGANLTFKENDRLPNLIHLYLASGILKFSQNNLPSLKSIGCKYTDAVMEELYSYRQMDNIAYSNVNENIFEKLSRLETLKKLDINRGKISSIVGIEAVKGLESLNLVLLSNLTQLEELTKIITLKKLVINVCKNIKNWKFLLELKSLNHLVLFGNDNNHPDKTIVNTLKSMGIIGVY
jgi:hypothetical protein